MDDEIRKLEEEFGKAIIQNDAEIIGRLLADAWVIIDPGGALIDKARFLDVLKSGGFDPSSNGVQRCENSHLREYCDRHRIDYLCGWLARSFVPVRSPCPPRYMAYRFERVVFDGSVTGTNYGLAKHPVRCG